MTDFDTRPLSIHHHSTDWYSSMNARQSDAGPSSTRARGFSSASSSTNARRRSSAAPGPHPGPPPDLPMPSLPPVSEALTPFPDYGLEEDEMADQDQDNAYILAERPTFDLTPFQRPIASSQLAAVAQFSQSRLNSNSVSPQPELPTNLSDSPPRSLLPRSSSSTPAPGPAPSPPSHIATARPSANDTGNDRNLLSPPDSAERSGQKKPSSRKALTRALELAREAVRLDSSNDDPYGAIQAYGQSVTLLKEVMERVQRGEDSTEHRSKNGRRRSVVAQEEEVRRLKNIVCCIFWNSDPRLTSCFLSTIRMPIA
jgi:hypothetical protein